MSLMLGASMKKIKKILQVLNMKMDSMPIKYSKLRCKSEVHLRTGHEGSEGKGDYRYSSILSLTAALDEVVGQCHVPAALPPGKTLYQSHTRLSGPQSPSGQVQKISPLSEFDLPTAQPVANRYTD